MLRGLLPWLLLGTLGQEPAPVAPEQPAAAAAAGQELSAEQRAAVEAWFALPPETRRRIAEGRARYQDLPPESQAEIQRRGEILRYRARLREQELNEVERRHLQGLPPHERESWLYDQASGELRLRHRVLRERFPELLAAVEEAPPERRPVLLRQAWEAATQDAARRGLEQLGAEGWIAPQVQESLRAAPAEYQHAAVLEALRWKLLHQARTSGEMARWGLDPFEEQRLIQMPALEFHHAFGLLRRGVPKHEALRPPLAPLGPGPGRFAPSGGPRPRGGMEPGRGGPLGPGGPGRPSRGGPQGQKPLRQNEEPRRFY